MKRGIKKNSLLPFTEAQLIEGLNEKLAHADLLTTPLSSEAEPFVIDEVLYRIIPLIGADQLIEKMVET